jgi:hypothetical protein
MLRRTLFLTLAALLAVLATSAKAQAWGAAHVGYTHVGPNGAYHYGHTAAVGPNGAYSGSHAGAYGTGGGSYHAGYGAAAGGGRYGAAAYGGYHTAPSYGGSAYYAGGFRTGALYR